MVKTRISREGRTTIPLPVREALDLAPGDRIAWRIEGGRAILARAEPDDPFAAFTEWASDADTTGYAGL
jgi:antitoxin PrlF